MKKFITILFLFITITGCKNTQKVEIEETKENNVIAEEMLLGGTRNDFLYTRDIIFNTTSSGANVSSSQTNFPVAVNINSSSFSSKELEHFFGNYNVGGKRIQFFDSDGTTNLNYEVEFYSAVTQEAIYWVKVPSVTGNSATDKIIVAYGNDPNGSNQDNANGVWDSNYAAVYHMQDGASSSSVNDSTSNANTGTKSSAGNPTQVSSASSGTVTIQVAASADDMTVYSSSGVWTMDALNYGYLFAGSYSASVYQYGTGMRFLNVAIPQGATIQSAKITFKANINEAGTTCNSKFVGDKETNAATFSTLADFQSRRGTDVGGANNNLRTTASVSWAISAWTSGTSYDSPDISTVIQEIVNQGGWASGNAMAIFWDDFSNLSTATALRAANSYDSSSSNAPILTVSYIGSPVDTGADKGQLYDTASEYIDAGNASSVNLQSSNLLTMEVYYKRLINGTFQDLLAKWNNAVRQSYFIAVRGDDNTCFGGIGDGGSVYYYFRKTTGTITDTNNHHIAMTWNNSDANKLNYYLDGTLDNGALSGVGTSTVGDIPEHLTIGTDFEEGVPAPNPTKGIIYEARLSKVDRSADWIKLTYFSLKKTNYIGDSFISFGNETGGPAIINSKGGIIINKGSTIIVN